MVSRSIATTIAVLAIVSLTSCASIFDIAKGIGNIFGSSTNSGTQVDANLDFKNGNNSYKLYGHDMNDNEISNSTLSGNDQYNARQIFIHNDNLKHLLISLIFGFMLSGLTVILFNRFKKSYVVKLNIKEEEKNTNNHRIIKLITNIDDVDISLNDRFALVYLYNLCNSKFVIKRKWIKMNIKKQILNLVRKNYVIDCKTYYKINDSLIRENVRS